MGLDHGNAVSPERLDEDQAPPIPSFSRSPFLETPLGQPDDNTMESEGVLDPEDIMKDEEVSDQEEEVEVNIGHSVRPSSVDSLVMRTTEMSGTPRMSNTTQLPAFSRSPTSEAPLGQGKGDAMLLDTVSKQEDAMEVDSDPIFLPDNVDNSIRRATEISGTPQESKILHPLAIPASNKIDTAILVKDSDNDETPISRRQEVFVDLTGNSEDGASPTPPASQVRRPVPRHMVPIEEEEAATPSRSLSPAKRLLGVRSGGQKTPDGRRGSVMSGVPSNHSMELPIRSRTNFVGHSLQQMIPTLVNQP
ncbi:hypothetical protein KCU95_g8170, partial [Aureobasidium melanogenum]